MRRDSQLSGNIHQRAIDLDDCLESLRDTLNRDQRIAEIRESLSYENALGFQRGWNKAKKAR